MPFARALIASLCLSAMVPPPLLAQNMTPAEARMIQTALDRGQLLYAYDQAAWHGTDAMLADAKARGLMPTLGNMLGGWIVSGGTNDPTVLFFDKNESDPHAVFTVQLADGGRNVRSVRFFGAGEDTTISPETRSLIRARQIATASAVAASPQRCSNGNFNTVVLAPDQPGAATLVYFLSPQSERDKVPFGGHYRIEVSPDGVAGPLHAFTKTCLDLPNSQAADKPDALIVTQLLDPLPTEVSVFTSFAAGLPIYVMTASSKKTWVVETSSGQARIRVAPDRPKS